MKIFLKVWYDEDSNIQSNEVPVLNQQIRNEAFMYVTIVVSLTLLFVSADTFEWLHQMTRKHESWNLDELIAVVPGILIVTIIFGVKRANELRKEIAKRREAEDQVRLELHLKKDFMNIVSHEMRTPINGIIALLGTLRTIPDEADVEENLDLAIEAAQGLTRQLDDIIAFSRIDHVVDLEQDEIVEPEGIFKRAIMILQKEAQDKGVALAMDVDANTPKMVLSKNVPINQIVLNLAHNALKFTSKGTVQLRCSFTDIDSPMLHLDVIDTGRGIPKDELQRIFTAYYQVQPETYGRFQGFGLGLSLVQRLVDMLGGTISVESELNRGSKFTVAIPVKLPEKNADQ